MKIFTTADVHSYLKPLKKALDSAGFDPQNPDHYFLSCGDLFDRGPDSDELLRFVMSLERKVLVRGNHDDLFEELCLREYPLSHDKSNGTFQAVRDIGKYTESKSFEECCLRAWQRTQAYRDSLVDYFETENHIFVHGWIPSTIRKTGSSTTNKVSSLHVYNPQWRQATKQEFEEARWVNGIEQFYRGIVEPGKNIVCGHWHCSYGHHLDTCCGEFGPSAIFDPYIKDGLIALDACTAYSGKVNVVVIEDNFI